MRIKAGAYAVEVVPACHFRLDGGGIFGSVPRVMWEQAYTAPDELNRVPFTGWALLIRGEDCVIVVDAGIGTKLGAKRDAIHALDHGPRGGLAGELRARNVEPEQVTHFIYTHLHFDHAGGATVLDGEGRAVPLFPRARHFVQRSQLEWARCPSEKDRASYYPDNWEPVAAAGLLEELDGPCELMPGLELRVYHGHTAGLQTVVIRGETEAGGAAWGGFAHACDLMPFAAHLRPAWIPAYDNHPLQALEDRKSFVNEAMAGGWLVMPGHDSLSPPGRIVGGEKGPRFEPAAGWP